MIFQDAHLSFLFLFVPILAGLLFFGFKQKGVRLTVFASKDMWSKIVPSLSYTRRFWKKFIIVVALALLVLTLMRPQYGAKFEKVSRRGRDIIIALDTSHSMLAQDVQPSRFAHAKREILGIVDHLKGDRIGLVAFSGSAFVYCPLTLDYGAVKLFLDEIQVGQIARPGTNLARAINTARGAFNTEEKKYKTLILLSDGESFDGNVRKAVDQAKKAGIRILTIGIGKSTGEPLPVLDDNGALVQYKKNKADEIILSKLNKVELSKISRKTGGQFFHSNNASLVTDDVYNLISAQEKKKLAETFFKRHKDRYQIVLAIVFVLLLLDVMIAERRRKDFIWRGRL
ncbi:MAG: Ca-activated chloride channel family protein [Candidatus Marinamargulisbacteria bacterium]|jgi:Ca-activated chloride channel family protein